MVPILAGRSQDSARCLFSNPTRPVDAVDLILSKFRSVSSGQLPSRVPNMPSIHSPEQCKCEPPSHLGKRKPTNISTITGEEKQQGDIPLSDCKLVAKYRAVTAAREFEDLDVDSAVRIIEECFKFGAIS